MSELFSLNMFKFENVTLEKAFLQQGGTQYNTTNICIGYILEGRVRYIYNGATFDGEAGDLIYGPDVSNYYSIWQGTPSAKFYTISFSFADKTDFSEYGLNIVKKYPRDNFEKIRMDYPDNMLKCLGAFYEILSDLYGGLLTVKKSVVKGSFVAKATEYIKNNAVDKITISDIAAHCGISESYLYSTFKRVYGCSPIRYKHNTLVKLAIQRLLYSEDSIEKICDYLGFSSSNYFRRVFKSVTGRSPSDFKKVVL